jgi:hypothetical protein
MALGKSHSFSANWLSIWKYATHSKHKTQSDGMCVMKSKAAMLLKHNLE